MNIWVLCVVLCRSFRRNIIHLSTRQANLGPRKVYLFLVSYIVREGGREGGREGEGEDVVGSTINCCFVGIVNRSRSSLGTKLLKSVPFPLIHSLMYSFCRLWFLRPLADIEALRQRQEAVEFLMSPSHEETTMNLHDCSKHIKNIPVREGEGGEREGGGSVG